MNEYFGEVKLNVFTNKTMRRGGSFNGKQYGVKSPDQTYIDAGLYPIRGDKPIYDKETHKLGRPEYSVQPDFINKTYPIIELTQEVLDANTYRNNMTLVNAITIDYLGHTYSGGKVAQSDMVTAMAKLVKKGDTKTAKWYTVDNKKVELTRDDFDNILDLIDTEQENILGD